MVSSDPQLTLSSYSVYVNLHVHVLLTTKSHTLHVHKKNTYICMLEVAKQQVCMSVSCKLRTCTVRRSLYFHIIVAVPNGMQCCNYYVSDCSCACDRTPNRA